MDLQVRRGERVEIKGKRLVVTDLDCDSLPRVREYLIKLAGQRSTTTYAGLKASARLPHAVNGLGRLLDLVGLDCERRSEPPLSALVVTSTTGEVGSDYEGDPARQREAVFAKWRHG